MGLVCYGLSERFLLKGLTRIIVISLILLFPLQGQVLDEDPVDEDDLRLLLEEEDLREYRRPLSGLKADSLLFDVRLLMGMTMPDSLLLPQKIDSLGNDPPPRRPMVVHEGMAEHRSVTLRTVVTWTSDVREDDMFRKDRNLVRWDTRNSSGEGSFGEIALSTLSTDQRSTSATLQYVGREERWEVAVGHLTDRGAIGPIADSRPLRLRNTDRATPAGDIDRPFSKPSFLNDAFMVTGIGVKAWLGERTHVVAVVGHEDLDLSGAMVGRLGMLFHMGERVSVGSGFDIYEGVSNTRQDWLARVTLDSWSVCAAGIVDRSAAPSYIVNGSVHPGREIRVAVTGWRKDVREPMPGTDYGLTVVCRWRFAPYHSLHMQSSGAEFAPFGSVRLQRSLVRLSIAGRLNKELQWTCSIRSSSEEAHEEGGLTGTRRFDFLGSVRRSLGSSLSTNISFRRSVSGTSPIGAGSSSLDVRLYGTFGTFACAMWIGTFDASPGMTLWASHPGLMLWPVSIAYGGYGFHTGTSVKIRLGGRATLAAYVSQIRKDGNSMFRSSIMSEIGL